MSDKETAPQWAKEAAEKIWRLPQHYNSWIEKTAQIIAAECTAPAPQPDWKEEALALVVLLRAKCSDEEWANMESRFECTAPAPQPAEAATEWKVFSREAHASLHGGFGALDYYPICAEVPKHECIALVFGKTDEEALRRAESILRQHFVRVEALIATE